jgi:Flp pilus assembly protein TadD
MTMALTKTGTVLILSLLTMAAYANTLTNSFVWDDVLLVVDNTHIRNSTYLPAIFTSDLYHGDAQAAAYYRPLQTVSYMVDYIIGGLNPFGFHLTNLLLHLTCVWLLWLLIEGLSGSRALALVVAALFAVHPLGTNAVTYISGRADSLAFAAMLVSFLLFRRYRASADESLPVRLATFAGCILAYVAALFSRENALLFPGLIAAHCLIFEADRRPKLSDVLQAVAPFAIVTLAFLLWRSAVIELHGKPVFPVQVLTPVERAEVFFRAVATYLGVLIWPAHLQMERQLSAGGAWLHMLTAVGGLGLLGLLCTICWAACRSPLAHFGLWWFAISLSPMLGLLNLTATVAEHWLYVPSIGIYLAVAAGLFHLQSRWDGAQQRRIQQAAAAGVFVALIALSLRTIHRNADWANDLVVHAKTKQTAPNSDRARNNLARSYLAAGQPGPALLELLEAERINPRDLLVKENLASLYLFDGRLDLAMSKNEECLHIDPGDSDALLRKAEILDRRGDVLDAKRQYIRATASCTALRPRLLFAMFLLKHNDLKQAIEVATEAYEIEPGNADVFNLLGSILARQHRFQNAEEAFRMACDLDRHSPTGRTNLDRLASAAGHR